ncbi:hypothetical protein F4802DRAFT_451096 [Xylaria palmicola]|nr:hypothetical protein F4802DRAFT_451096 [Xylaria palmicola]
MWSRYYANLLVVFFTGQATRNKRYQYKCIVDANISSLQQVDFRPIGDQLDRHWVHSDWEEHRAIRDFDGLGVARGCLFGAAATAARAECRTEDPPSSCSVMENRTWAGTLPVSLQKNHDAAVPRPLVPSTPRLAQLNPAHVATSAVIIV